METFGLTERQRLQLQQLFGQHAGIVQVKIYGSRAKGTCNPRSDVDLVICNSQLSRHELGLVTLDIQNSDFPNTVDIQNWEDIKSEALREQIARVGKMLYEKDTNTRV